MPAAAALTETSNFDSVASIVAELNANFSRQFELREDLVAKGIPSGAVEMLVDHARSDTGSEFEAQCQRAANLAREKFGLRAVSLPELKSSVATLAELDEDAVFVKKMAKSKELNTQALSMLTNIIRQNPGDGGSQILSLLLEYGTACGVTIKGLEVVENNTKAPESVLPVIDASEPQREGIFKYRELLIEIALGLVITYSALVLLT